MWGQVLSVFGDGTCGDPATAPEEFLTVQNCTIASNSYEQRCQKVVLCRFKQTDLRQIDCNPRECLRHCRVDTRTSISQCMDVTSVPNLIAAGGGSSGYSYQNSPYSYGPNQALLCAAVVQYSCFDSLMDADSVLALAVSVDNDDFAFVDDFNTDSDNDVNDDNADDYNANDDNADDDNADDDNADDYSADDYSANDHNADDHNAGDYNGGSDNNHNSYNNHNSSYNNDNSSHYDHNGGDNYYDCGSATWLPCEDDDYNDLDNSAAHRVSGVVASLLPVLTFAVRMALV
ncbi:MAG: hypothetical protein MHM6MM_004304 [Cercozoa sp. M6MM]